LIFPEGLSEADFIAAVDRSVQILGPDMMFGPFTIEDLRQECYLWGMELLATGRYDASRPFGNYVFVHLRRRLLNLRRKHLSRYDFPCVPCGEGRGCQENGGYCLPFQKWKARQDKKKALSTTASLEISQDTTKVRNASPVEQDVQANELMALLDEGLSEASRKVLDALLSNQEIGSREHMRLRVEVRAILEELAELEDELPLADLYRGLVAGLRLAG
jgi:hypothetical protein